MTTPNDHDQPGASAASVPGGMPPGTQPWIDATQDFHTKQLLALGAYIREQRLRNQLSLRQLAELANVSNPYLSQIERGLHEPSVRVLKAIAAGLDLSAEVILAEAGLLERAAGLTPSGGQGDGDGQSGDRPAVEAAIDRDPLLTADQKGALIQVYRSYLASRSSRR